MWFQNSISIVIHGGTTVQYAKKKNMYSLRSIIRAVVLVHFLVDFELKPQHLLWIGGSKKNNTREMDHLDIIHQSREIKPS
jgi:hypothetical protein